MFPAAYTKRWPRAVPAFAREEEAAATLADLRGAGASRDVIAAAEAELAAARRAHQEACRADEQAQKL